MKRTLLAVFLFVLVSSCSSGEKTKNDKDFTDDLSDEFLSEQDVNNDEPDNDSPLTEHDSLVTDDSSTFTDDKGEPDGSASDMDSESSDNESPDADSGPEEYSVNGYVQKGPFIKDTEIQITELDENFEMIPSTSFTTKTVDDLGNFNILRKFKSRFIEIKATGFYYDEVAGSVSTAQMTNYVFVDLSAANTTMNINILTTLARKRIIYLMKQGKSFVEARSQSEKEILEIFGIFQESSSSFQDMNILKTGSSNAMLLAISARLQGNNTPGELSALIAGIIYDIETDGVLNDETLITKISDGGKYISSRLSSIRNGLDNHFGSLTSVDVPDFEQYCDNDGDGIINKWDFTVNLGSYPSADLVTSYDSYSIAVVLPPYVSSADAVITNGTIILNGTDTASQSATVVNGDVVSIRITSGSTYSKQTISNLSVTYTDMLSKVQENKGAFIITTRSSKYFTLSDQLIENASVNTLYTSTQKNISLPESIPTATASVTAGTVVVNGIDTGLTSTTLNRTDTVAIGLKLTTANTNVSGKLTVSYLTFTEQMTLTVTDWRKSGSLYWSPISSSQLTWSAAGTYCTSIGGRLPTINELRTLIRTCPGTVTGGGCQVTDGCTNSVTCYNETACASCPSKTDGSYSALGDTCWLWSSTTVLYVSYVWGVYFTTGNVGSSEKGNGNWTRCVK